ncbi:MAG TPA: MFS transporter, partial [Candidatus Kryptonia bacterium]|nr:MFS transporter [Candidatus Kryptonia bacterium]
MTASPGHAPADTGHRAAVLAGFLGWTLDAFDFFLVVFSLTAIGKEFDKSDADVALSITLTLAFRPVGAFIFGLMADRYGRRIPLMIDLVFYSVVEVASGLAPNYSTFLVLRALFGIGMGGEWGVGASLAMEKAPSRQRGMLSGLLQEGYAAGYLLAAVVYFTVFPRWGWRPLFFIGGLPALLAVFVRARVTESEVWKQNKHDSWGQLGRAIVSHWRLFCYLTILMAMMNCVSHGTQDMYPTFLQREWGFTPAGRAGLTAFSMIGAIIGGVVFGYFSDHIGRRRAIVTALICAMVVAPVWAFAPSLALLIAGAFAMQFMVQGAWGVIPAHLNELSPDSVRGFL